MKEFEKWFKKPKDFHFATQNVTVKLAYETALAWRAALEWIRFEGVICDEELAGKLIKEELQGDK